MSAGMLFVLWKGLLGFALPLAVAFWELRNLRKYREQDAAELAARDARAEPAAPRAEPFRKAA